MGMTDWGGVIFQVKKRRARDEGLQRNILTAALSISLGARLGIVVDEDVDIYNIEDVLWALTTRVNPKDDVLTICEGGFGQTFQPAERSSAGDRQWTQSNIRFSGAMGIDATRPFIHRDAFERARYNVEVVGEGRAARLRQVPGGARDLTERHHRVVNGEEGRHGLRNLHGADPTWEQSG
jgi:4-hydroxy-3-polyprenylbenzoate decarboxylase